MSNSYSLGTKNEVEEGSCLVGLGYHNKYYRLDGLNNRHLFLTVLRLGSTKIKVPADSVPAEGSFAESHL